MPGSTKVTWEQTWGLYEMLLTTLLHDHSCTQPVMKQMTSQKHRMICSPHCQVQQWSMHQCFGLPKNTKHPTSETHSMTLEWNPLTKLGPHSSPALLVEIGRWHGMCSNTLVSPGLSPSAPQRGLAPASASPVQLANVLLEGLGMVMLGAGEEHPVSCHNCWLLGRHTSSFFHGELICLVHHLW